MAGLVPAMICGSAALYQFVIASAAKQSRIFPRRDSGLLRCARNDGGLGDSPYPTLARFGSTISNILGNSSIRPISSASFIGLPDSLILPAATASGKLVSLAIAGRALRVPA
ncbi:hypothetical protein ACVIIV_006827 [Bradyrhizobium sp. USDA 4354]